MLIRAALECAFPGAISIEHSATLVTFLAEATRSGRIIVAEQGSQLTRENSSGRDGHVQCILRGDIKKPSEGETCLRPLSYHQTDERQAERTLPADACRSRSDSETHVERNLLVTVSALCPTTRKIRRG